MATDCLNFSIVAFQGSEGLEERQRDEQLIMEQTEHSLPSWMKLCLI